MTSKPVSPQTLLRQHFAALLKARGYRADTAQQAAIDRLGRWLSAFLAGRDRWLRKPAAGVYLWGGVGRGKSFVMDALFAAAPIEAKRRVHFHAFLAELQERIRAFSGQPDPLVLAARELAGQTRLLCFDEFHVHDIGDAMLLGRLLKVLVEEGVGVVCTSNYPPSGLCPNPLYRDRFTAAIELLEKRFVVVEMDNGHDYRQHSQRDWGRYYWPLVEPDVWQAGPLAAPSELRAQVLQINRRDFPVIATGPDCVWIEFAALCRSPRSSADFLWLCQRYSRLVVACVPALEHEYLDVQQRFLNFIDIVYDSDCELWLGASAELSVLCKASSHTDFSRTYSRLQQLQALPLEHAASLMSGSVI